MTSARARRRLLESARRREPAAAARAERERSCGTCAACCVTHRIDALEKPAGAACARLRPEDDPGAGRCSDYHGRPEDCREWACVWRRGFLEPEERPDRVGVVVDVLSFQPQILDLAEWTPGDLDRPEARRLLSRLQECGEVTVAPLPKDGRRHLPVAP